MANVVTKPAAKVAAFSLTGSTTQTILASVRITDQGYILFRNLGAAIAFFNVLTSTDGGVNFHNIPDPQLNTDGIPASTNVQPWPIPPPTERGDLLKITGKSAGTTVDVEVYMPDLRRRIGVGAYLD